MGMFEVNTATQFVSRTFRKLKCVPSLCTGIRSRVFSDLQNIQVQKALHQLHGWHNNGLWHWFIRSWYLQAYHRGISPPCMSTDCCNYGLIYTLYIVSEDCSSYARKWNRVVSRCWIFLYSCTQSWRRGSWYAFSLSAGEVALMKD